MKKTTIIPHRYKNKIKITGSCWLWTGHINNVGYGRYGNTYVHRDMFLLQYGYLPLKPSVVGHKCEVRNCVNPEHLVEQSQRQNVKQYQDKITHCPSGHEYCARNTYYRKTSTGTSRKCRECNRLQEAERRRIRSLV